jgi:hypothetical protein
LYSEAYHFNLAPDKTQFIDLKLPAEVAKIGNFYLYGTIWYDDIFSNHHWSQFCYAIHCDSTLTNTVVGASPRAVHSSCDETGEN